MSRRLSHHRASLFSPSTDLADSSAEDDERPSSSARPVPQARSHAPTNLSSSHSTKPHARSFNHASNARPDLAQYSSQGVREQTAELASWMLSDNPFLSPKHSESAGRSEGSSSTKQRLDTLDPSLPHVEETSEPGTPDLPSSSHPPPSSMFGHGERTSTAHVVAEPKSYLNDDSDPAPDIMVEEVQPADEHTPLLLPPRDHKRPISPEPPNHTDDVEGQTWKRRQRNTYLDSLAHARHRTAAAVHTLLSPKTWNRRAIWEKGVKEPVGLLPCVFLGILLNVLDALSYGMILFPLGEPIFANTGPDGISMFYVSCIVSQLVFSLGGSIFKGAVGSEMIEVVPFFHKMTYTIMARTGTSDPKVVLATVITSYALSSIITGLVFFLLGAFKLGSLVSFFPRHILIGCIGGVGFFLFVTGIEVSARLGGTLEYNIDTLKKLFRGDTIALWIIPLALSIILLVVKRYNSSPYIVPAYFIAIAGIFYIVVAAVPALNLSMLREQGWIFAAVEAGVPFYHFYSYYDFNAVDWEALARTIPAMLALTFFGILHVPINVPALGIAAEEDDLDLNRELRAHGISNALSGFLGSIQNYLVYVNSDMFIQNGGNSRLAGVMLAIATFGVLIAGPTMIGYVPIMVVGALIFYLGIALLEEALIDPWGRMTKLEYFTIVAIVLIMGIYDFVAGILAGIMLALLNFVVQTSRKSAVRTAYSGDEVKSTVRRHPVQLRFLNEVGYQIYVTKLAGFLFFGSIVEVEKQSRALVEEEFFRKQPIRYLIFDLAHVNGLDYSAAEAFKRLERVLGRRDVKMLVSGVAKDNDVGKAFQGVGLWQDNTSVKFFESLNTALESCENELLEAYSHAKDSLAAGKQEQTKSSDMDIPNSKATSGNDEYSETYGTPRKHFLRRAATITIEEQHAITPKRWQSFKQPLPLILQTFQGLSTENEDFWFEAVPYFEKLDVTAGSVLFEAGDAPNGFYLLSEGMLRATYSLPVGEYQESIVAGTTCGELPFFSSTLRTATVVAETDCVCWQLTQERWKEMQLRWPEGATALLQVALKLTKERVDAVTSYVLTTAG